MVISKTTSSQIARVGWITFAWVIFALFQYLVSYGAIVELGVDLEKVDLRTPFVTSIFTGVLAGLLGGSGVVFLWERWLRSKPYGWTIRSILLSYLIIFVVVAIPSTAVYQSGLLNKSMFDRELWSIAFYHLLSPTTLIPLISWLVIVAITIIVLLVNDKYGPGVFVKFLMGRYFNPRREQRIFMFLDLRSSTSIAENLGEEKYFSFLRDVFKYATPAILKYQGEIYQYVGDEIVISWELGAGAKKANCIQCYFEIQQALRDRTDFFLEQYQTQPEFKAGVHYGHVMAGEIGVVKREIAFSGDVLNTTARIQSKCNELGVDLLASENLIGLLNLDEELKPKRIGEIELRGKKERVTLFTV